MESRTSISASTISGDNHKTKRQKTDILHIGFFGPENNAPMQALSPQELHNLAMNIVGRELEASGYEFMGVNSKPGQNPQFVCLREKTLHFIVVRPVPFPEDPQKVDSELMEKVKAHAEKFEARTYYAGVGLYNAEDRFAPVYLNEKYLVDYAGLIEI